MVLWWAVVKIVAIVLILVGLYMIIFLPGIIEHQGSQFGFSAIIFGFILVVIGGFLLFA